MKTTKQYQCGNCRDGVVKSVVTESKTIITVKVGDCNVCKKSYGIMSVGALTELPADETRN